jgi:uncharacterized membrane-anchored protein
MGTATPPATGKVPAATLSFWIIKIAATTLGETGGDALSMSLGLGYALSTVIFFAIFAAAAAAQIAARAFHPALYWSVIVATTTVGTTMADFADRSLGIGYIGGTLILAGLLAVTLGVWWAATGSVSAASITTRKAESFYWLTIVFSNTLGTALGDFAADTGGLGYEGGALLFGGLLVVVGMIYGLTRTYGAVFFWLGFILTRPLGATVGDLLTKPHSHGGLHLSRISSSLAIALLIVLCIAVLPQRPARTAAAA